MQRGALVIALGDLGIVKSVGNKNKKEEIWHQEVNDKIVQNGICGKSQLEEARGQWLRATTTWLHLRQEASV